MNIGQVLETHLGWAAHSGWPEKGKKQPEGTVLVVATPIFDGAREIEIEEALVGAGLPPAAKPPSLTAVRASPSTTTSRSATSTS